MLISAGMTCTVVMKEGAVPETGPGISQAWNDREDLGLYRPLSRFWSSILTSSFRLCLWCSRYNASSCAALRRRPSITASIKCLRTDRRSVCAGGFKIEGDACIVIVVSLDLSQCPATFFCKTFSVVALPPTRRSAKMRFGGWTYEQSRLTEEPRTE